MANDELVQTLLRIKLDQSAANATRTGIQGIKGDLTSLSTNANESTAAAGKLVSQLEDVNKIAKSSGGNLRSVLGATGQIAGSLIPGAGQLFGVAGAVTELKQQFGGLKETIGGLSGGMKAAGVAGIAFGVALAILNQRFQEGKKAAGEELDARQKALDLLRTGTKEEVQSRIDALQQAKDAREADAANAQKFLQNLRDGIKQNFGEAGAAIAEINAKLGTGAPELAKAIENADAATKALSTTNTELDLLTQGLGTNATAQADLAASLEATEAAAKKLSDQLFKYAQDDIAAQVESRKQIRDLYRNGTQEDLDNARFAAQEQINITQDRIEAERDYQKSFEIGSEQYKAVQQILDDLSETQDAQIHSLSALKDANLDVAVAQNEAIKATVAAGESITNTYKQYQDDVLSITSKYNENYASLEKKRIDTVEKIQQDAVDSAAKLLADLQQKQSDLKQNLDQSLSDDARKRQQTELQNQIDFQRNEVRSEQKYQDDIARIKKQAQDNEFELALDRDFAGLARSRRQTANQISEVGSQAQKDRQARQTALKEQAQDQNAAYLNERQNKLDQYQRSLSEAQAQYQREYRQATINRNRALAAAQQDYNTQLNQLNSSLRKELDLRYRAAQSEISLARQTTETRQRMFASEYQAALKFFNITGNILQSGNSGGTGGGGGGGSRGRAFGGSLDAFSGAMVNEKNSSGNESFRAGGKSAQFPNTAGYFIPFQTGNVDKGNSGGQSIIVNSPITVSGVSDSQEVANIIDKRLETTIRRIFVNKA